MRIPAYHRPTTLEDAWRHKAAEPDASFIAGGTDILVRIREGSQRPPALVSLRNIPELRGVDMGPPITFGALTPVADLCEHAQLRAQFPALVAAASGLGSTQIRNLATVGGNLCNASPCADLAPPLLTLDAQLSLASPAGARELSLEDFFVAPGQTRVGPDEIVTAVHFEPTPAHTHARFFKRGRVAMDIAIASVAVLVRLDGRRCVHARVAAGSVGPRPLRLPKTEAVLDGAELDEELLARARAVACQEVSPITDKRSTESYRRHIVGVYVERALRSILSEAAPS